MKRTDNEPAHARGHWSARHPRVAAVVALTGASLAMGPWAPQASAISAQSGSLTMESDAGDYVGGGSSYAYTTDNGDGFDSTANGSTVRLSVSGANGDWWFLEFAAPAGQSLVEGSYSGATRAPFREPGAPGLDVGGNGRGCNELTGTFTVLQADLGPSNYLERFGATFEQHCEGGLPALRGEVWVVNPPAPTPLELGVMASPVGTVERLSGTAVVSGSVTCNLPTTVWVAGTLVQRASRTTVSQGAFFLNVACSGTTPWEATVRASNGVPFNPGKAALDVDATGYDTTYGGHVNASSAATVRLTGGATR